MGSTQNTGGGGLFSSTNMQQKSNFGGNQGGLFTPKTMASNTNVFGNQNKVGGGGMFGSSQNTNTMGQGGIFGKTGNTMNNNIMSFNNTNTSNTSKSYFIIFGGF